MVESVVPAERIRAAVRTGWHRAVQECVPLGCGTESTTWAVVSGDDQYVVTLVPTERRVRYVAGLAAAAHLDARGFAAGAPERASNGQFTFAFEGAVLALVRYVPGRELDRHDPVDQQWWGDTLATVHRGLTDFHHPGLVRFHWVRSDAAHLAVEDWVRPAVTDAVAAVGRLSVTDQLTYGVLHGDPAPEAFRLDVHTGRLGLVDWGSVARGPLTYDVASAVMYAGGPGDATELIDGYLSGGCVPPDELTAALPTMLRFRWAVQVDHFARRVAADDSTGLAGLHHARDMLARLSTEDC